MDERAQLLRRTTRRERVWRDLILESPLERGRWLGRIAGRVGAEDVTEARVDLVEEALLGCVRARRLIILARVFVETGELEARLMMQG